MAKMFMLKMLKFYKKYISPGLPNACRFVPTCSEYAYAAVEKYGVCKGAYLALLRLLRCNPLFKGGYDPLK